MSDFSRPEYTSYVQLCRELDREKVCYMCSGHGRIAHDKETGEEYAFVDCPLCSGLGKQYPTLSDWLEMLEEANAWWLRLEIGTWEERPEHRWTAEAGLTTRARLAQMGPTPEEAAARLWMATR